MRCLACNVSLSDFEATRKYRDGTYLDLCTQCFLPIEGQIETKDRLDLLNDENEHLTDGSDCDTL